MNFICFIRFLFSARPMIELSNYEITVLLRNNRRFGLQLCINSFSQLLQYIDKHINDLNFISVLLVFFLVLGQ